MIVPAPRHLEARDGVFRLADTTTLRAAEPARLAADALRRDLGRATGYAFPDAAADDAAITITVDPVHLPPEAYTLTVSPDRIEIIGGDAAGAFYGVQSLRQLLPRDIFAADVVRREWTVPCVTIDDRPAFGWRGTMLDVARHFFPKEYVLRLIDLLALHRLNVLHLHLTDDQGWRLPVPGYPKLTEISAWRSGTLIGHGRTVREGDPTYDDVRHGGFYTADDLREIVTYAAERFVMVVPEIDMPGHMQAVLAAYPELGNTGEPVEVRRHWGISTNVLGVHDEAVQFCKDVLAEIVNLFPAPFVHCGGDEVPKTEWQNSERAQAKIRELGLTDEQALQQWFTAQMASFLAERGRRFVGWDEVLEGGGPEALPEDVVVMSWRSEEGGITAARASRDVVMAPCSHVYLDYYQGDRESEPLAIGGHTPLSKVYEYEPVPALLRGNPDAVKHILGAQCQLWTEYVPTPEHADYMLFPRVCAFAEAVWRESPGEYAEFLTRLRQHADRLDVLGVNYRPLD